MPRESAPRVGKTVSRCRVTRQLGVGGMGGDNIHTYPNIVFSRGSFNALSGSVGTKLNLRDRLLVDGNLLFALDEDGVRDRVVPLIALEYAF